MFLSRIRIANFKSLKDVEINSEGLVAMVGPNGSGKTNFALAMKFLSEVHQHGLEMAISRAGGFENIAYRKARRTQAPIGFEVEVLSDPDQMSMEHLVGMLELFRPRSRIESIGPFVVRHSFAFKACTGGIRAEFVVAHEEFQLEVSTRVTSAGFSHNGPGGSICTLTRTPEGSVEVRTDGQLKKASKKYRVLEARAGEQELFITSPYHRDLFMGSLSSFLAQVGVFHFSSDKMRGSGTPTPNPALTMPGANLPALVGWLQRKHPKTWAGILNAMRDIVPDLKEIMVQILPSKTLGLFFSEQGFGRPWGMDEVSDGTIHALSMLVAAGDPRTSSLVIEEPESSLHPWIIHELTKKLRELSKTKSIFLTTQSPIVIDALKPSEVWIVSRLKGKTEIQQLTQLDPQIEEDWSKGKYGLSDALDAGLIPRAVPGGRT